MKVESKDAPPSGSLLERYLNTFERCSASHYGKIPFVFARAKGCRIWDVNDKEYLDAIAGYSADNLGHHHPAIDAVGRAFFSGEKPFIVPNKVPTTSLIQFLDAVTKFFGYEKFIPMNSGAEAVETAIKIALKWAYTVKKVESDQAIIVCCERNFHGRTRGNISMSSHTKYKEHFGPYADMVEWVPFGDTDSLKATLDALEEYTAAFIVEPIQGEAGIVVPPDGYLNDVKALCKEYNTLLIADEVQTGLGRAGKKLLSEDAHPHMVCIGKSLGGGVVPVSGVLFDSPLSVFEPGDHGSTYAGGSFGAAIAMTVLEVIERDCLCEASKERGFFLKKDLIDSLRGNPCVAEVRGEGLMLGVVFTEGVKADKMALRCIENGVLTIASHNTIRICPPLIITNAECGEIVERISRALRT